MDWTADERTGEVLVDLDWRAVVASQPAGGMLRFRADGAALIWSDPASVRFASEVGVPYSRGLFRILGELADRDPDTPEGAFVEGDPEPIGTAHGRLSRIGELYQSDVFVSLDDGTIWVSDPDSEVEFELVNGDISSLSYLVYKVEGERPGSDERPTPHDWRDIKEIIREGMGGWDQVPFENQEGFWERFLEWYPML